MAKFLNKTLFFTILVIISSGSATTISASRLLTPETNSEFIRKSCNSTTYPKLCYNTLSVHATKIQQSPKLLAHAALNVTLASSKSTSAMMVKLSQTHGLRPREAAAMRDCVEELSDSVYQLRRSIGELGGKSMESDFFMMISDVQTWVSAALTDESTCSDGFGGSELNGKMKSVVRGTILNIAHLTSNALALVNNYASQT